MNHLDNTTLNLYLDDALDAKARARADAHLAECETCPRELASLRALTAAFDAWRAEPIPRDVSAAVMTRIATRPLPTALSRWGAVMLGAQLVLAILILMWALPTLLRVLNGLQIAPLPAFTFDFARVLEINLPYTLPFPALDAWLWVAVLIGGAVMWFVSNRLILSSLERTRANGQEATQ